MSALFAIDPALNGDIVWQTLAIVGIKVLIVFVAGLVATMLMVWFERKVIAGMQNRIGPNKTGPSVSCRRSQTASNCSSRKT